MFDDVAKRSPLCERRERFHDHECKGHLTFEHVWKYRGRQIEEPWAIIHICEWAHGVGPYAGKGLDKRKNEAISLEHLDRMTREAVEIERLKYKILIDFVYDK